MERAVQLKWQNYPKTQPETGPAVSWTQLLMIMKSMWMVFYGNTITMTRSMTDPLFTRLRLKVFVPFSLNPDASTQSLPPFKRDNFWILAQLTADDHTAMILLHVIVPVGGPPSAGTGHWSSVRPNLTAIWKHSLPSWNGPNTELK